jgi:hypothetical protein
MTTLTQSGVRGCSKLINSGIFFDAPICFEALMTDSRVGLTFAHLASEAVVGSEKRIPNQMNVHKVYGIVLSVRQNESLCGGELGTGRRSGQI